MLSCEIDEAIETRNLDQSLQLRMQQADLTFLETTTMNPHDEAAQVPPLLTAKQLAKLLQISTRSIWRLRSAGKLPKPVEIGGSVRWNHQTVREWVSQGCPDAPKKK
ncbi:MAG: helix-turn-helix domain-containing protein [Planctomycetaceae bacterium]|nr:helix-turn-helix domain-containing protein [Planctomycetaceae bacterium]